MLFSEIDFIGIVMVLTGGDRVIATILYVVVSIVASKKFPVLISIKC